MLQQKSENIAKATEVQKVTTHFFAPDEAMSFPSQLMLVLPVKLPV